MLCFAEQSVDSLWAQGNKAYQEGNYVGAVSCYSEIRMQGLNSSDLYFNLGNAYFKQNRIAESILSYERAIRLSPSNDNYRYNLEIAKLKVVDKIEVIPPFFLFKWIDGVKNLFGPNGWAITAIVFFALLAGSILLWKYGYTLTVRSVGFWISASTAFIFVISLLISFSVAKSYDEKNDAIILRPVVTVKSSPDQNGKDIFILHEGTKVEIIDSLSRWIEVKVSDGNSGWINSGDLERI